MIRIKVKHILLIIAIVASVLFTGIYFVPRIMYISAVTYQAMGNQEKANAIFRKLELQYPNNQLSVKSLYKRCANQFTTNHSPLSFSEIYASISTFGTSSPGQIIKPEDIDKINGEYMTISKTAHRNEDFKRLEMVVGLMNWFGGNIDKAVELENNARSSDSKVTRDEATLYLAIMNMQLGNLSESSNILENISDKDTDLSYYKSIILSSISILKGEIVKNPSQNNYPDKARNTLVNIHQPMSNIYRHDSFKTNSGKAGLKGYVKASTDKLAGVIIGLCKAEIYENGGIGGSMSLDYMTLAKSDGSFEFKNVYPGKYFIVIEAPWFRIEDSQVYFEGIENNLNRYIELYSNKIQSLSISFNTKFNVRVVDNNNGKVDLSWPSVPGATYYHIAVGPIIKGEVHSNDFFNATFSMSTKDTKYTFDTNKYCDINTDIYSYSSFDDRNVGGIDANPILGAFYQSGEYGISVTAYDTGGQAISSTEPVSTSQALDRIKISGVILSEADELLIDHKYEEAISEYKRLITVNPRDTHSIRMLAVLYKIGYLNDGTGRDLTKAKEYYEMLDSISPSSYTSLELGKIYLEKNNLTEAIVYFKKIEDEYFERNNQLFTAYYFNGSFYDAYKSFMDYKASLSYGYLDPNVLCIQLLRGYFKEVSTIVGSNYYFEEPKAVEKLLELPPDKKYQDFFKLMKNGNRSDAEAWLQKQKSSDSWRIFYEGILNLSISDKVAAKEAFNKTLRRFGNSQRDTIMIKALSVLARNCRGL
jgi:tetratricopeptide (TPR) repeat protein